VIFITPDCNLLLSSCYLLDILNLSTTSDNNGSVLCQIITAQYHASPTSSRVARNVWCSQRN